MGGIGGGAAVERLRSVSARMSPQVESPIGKALSEEVKAVVELRSLYGRYFSCVDANDAEGVGRLFTEDGALVSNVMGWTCTGRQAIVNYIDQLRSSWTEIRIHIASPSIVLADASHADGSCYFTVLDAHGIDHWGVYADIFEKHDGSWLFSKRSIDLIGRSPDSRAGLPMSADKDR
jgi:uncharacterized protein (TIGR02246 family)